MRWSVLAALAASIALAPDAAPAEVTYVPVQFIEISGVRPFVHVEMNGKPFQMMVHSNANFFVMASHATAKAAGVGNITTTGSYGISSAGHVSDLGRGTATLATLQVGRSINRDVRLSVFETAHPEMQGMLGVLWLRANRVIVDYDASRLGTAESMEDSVRADRSLRARGFTAHPMRWNPETKGYFITGTINGQATNLAVSTVADDVLDVSLADRLKIAYTKTGERFAGPTGTQGDVSMTDAGVPVSIDGDATVPGRAQVFDYYAYNRLERPADGKGTVDGTLGSQFMLSNHAVIDFGTDTLFLKKDVTP